MKKITTIPINNISSKSIEKLNNSERKNYHLETYIHELYKRSYVKKARELEKIKESINRER